MKISGPLRKGLEFTHLGMTMMLIVVLFAGGGYYLDGYFGTGNVLTVVGVIVGAFMGLGYFIMEIYRLATEGLNDDETDDRDDERMS